MAFLAPVFGAVTGAIGGIATFLGGGSLLARVALAGLSIAAQYALGKVLGKKPQKSQAQASQLQTSYGENLARTVIFGKVGTAGHLVYRNAYGKGNSIIQDVYVLSHFRINGVTRVRYNGEWKTLGGTVDANKGYRIQGIDAEIWVKVYSGTMSQTADAALIANSNPSGRWTSAHKGVGVAYAIVTSVLQRDTLTNPWEAFFEVEGAPLYDWRLDTTAGGTGSHRWSDQSTWAYSTNPVLMMYVLERGIFNGTEMMVGKGALASSLPIANWTTAANIADEDISLEKRYQASLIVSSGEGVTHDQNMQPLLESCAGSWVELVGQEYPIVGAAQSSAFSFTDDDLCPDEPFRFSAKRPRTELVNTVAGSYVDPVSFYAAVPFTTRVDASALAADRERIAVSIPYAAVTVPACVDRLADIAIRASRYQASAEICLRPKFLAIQPGQWVTWTSARRGWTKKFQVTSKRLGPFGPKSARNVYVSLQEVADGVFDATAYTTSPPDAVGRGSPDYLGEVENFQVSPYTVVDPDSNKRYPAIRATWDSITDPTVTGVDIQYRPKFQTAAVISDAVPVDQVVVILTNGLVSATDYEVRTRLRTQPARVVAWTDWTTVTTPDAPATDLLVYLFALASDAYETLQGVYADMDDLRAEMEQMALASADQAGASAKRDVASARYQSASATALREVKVSVGENADGLTAQASITDALQAKVGDASSDVLWRLTTEAGTGDIVARVVLQVRATTGDDWIAAGTIWEAGFTGGDPGSPFSRILMNTSQFVVTDGTNEGNAFTFTSGEMTLATMRAQTIKAARLQSLDGKKVLDFATGVLDFQY